MTKPTTPGIAELLDAYRRMLVIFVSNGGNDAYWDDEPKAAILAHVADLEAQRDYFAKLYGETCEKYVSVQTQRDEALKDAGRMDFLEDKDRCYWVDVQRQPDGMMMYAGQGPGLREAIDAAIAQRGASQGS